MNKREYILVESIDDIKDPLDDRQIIAVDLETTGLNPVVDEIHGVAFAMDNRIGYYSTNIELIRKVLEHPDWTKVFHNAVFDLAFLKAKGFKVVGPIHDTMLIAHNLDADRVEGQGLKELSRLFIGDAAVEGAKLMTDWLKSNNLDRSSIVKAPRNILVQYAAEDALNTYTLLGILGDKLRQCAEWADRAGYKKNPIDCYTEEDLAIIPVVVDMKLLGVQLDLNGLAQKQLELDVEMKQILKELPNDDNTRQVESIIYNKQVETRKKRNKTGELKKMPAPIKFNWESNEHLKVLFFDILKEKILKKTKKGNATVDAEIVEQMATKYPWAAKLLQYRVIKKIVGTYLNGYLRMQHGGVIRASFNIAGTATGRFSSSEPNMQNLPKHGNVKSLFVPRKGCKFIYADYSQLELRIAAHLSGDELMINDYCSGKPDLHRKSAAIIFNKSPERVTDEERSLGKTVNFAIIYDAGPYRLCEILGYFKDLDMAHIRELWQIQRENKNIKLEPSDVKLLDKYEVEIAKGRKIKTQLFTKYEGLAKYIVNTQKELTRYNLCITEFGRLRRLNGLDSKDRKEYSHALKSGFNMPIQSFGASLTKKAMIKLHSLGIPIVSQIHDAIICEVPEKRVELYKELIAKTMAEVATLKVPLIAEPKILNSFEEK